MYVSLSSITYIKKDKTALACKILENEILLTFHLDNQNDFRNFKIKQIVHEMIRTNTCTSTFWLGCCLFDTFPISFSILHNDVQYKFDGNGSYFC